MELVTLRNTMNEYLMAGLKGSNLGICYDCFCVVCGFRFHSCLWPFIGLFTILIFFCFCYSILYMFYIFHDF